MSDTSTTLLNNAVSYDWEELKKLSREVSLRATPIPSKVESVSPVELSHRPAPMSVASPARTASPTELQALSAKIVQEVSKQLLEEIDLVVELALKKTRAHLRSDLERTIALNVERAVRDSLK